MKRFTLFFTLLKLDCGEWVFKAILRFFQLLFSLGKILTFRILFLIIIINFFDMEICSCVRLLLNLCFWNLKTWFSQFTWFLKLRLDVWADLFFIGFFGNYVWHILTESPTKQVLLHLLFFKKVNLNWTWSFFSFFKLIFYWYITLIHKRSSLSFIFILILVHILNLSIHTFGVKHFLSFVCPENETSGNSLEDLMLVEVLVFLFSSLESIFSAFLVVV